MPSDLEIPPMPNPPGDPMRSGGDEAQCWALMGAMGGVGVSTLAISLAHSAVRHGADDTAHMPKVCLIDLDFECGALASYLDMPPGIKLEHLTGEASEIDSAMLSAFVMKHPSGIELLAAPNQLGGNDKVNPQSVLAMLDAASQVYDILILDVPRLWRPWTHAAMAVSNHVHLVTDLTIPALAIARTRLTDIENMAGLQKPFDLVVSKYERRATRTSISAKQAERAIGRDIAHFICTDTSTTLDAINCGEPAGSLNTDSRYVKDVMQMTLTLMGRAPSAQAVKRRSIFKRRAA